MNIKFPFARPTDAMKLDLQFFAGESRGIDFLIYVAADDAAVFQKVAGQRGGTFNMSSDEIDLTSKDNYGFADRDYGVQDWSIDGDGVFIEGDTSHEMILEAFLSRTTVRVRWQFPSGKRYEGDAIISEFPIEAPYDDVATYSISLLGKGPFRAVDGDEPDGTDGGTEGAEDGAETDPGAGTEYPETEPGV